MTNKFTKRQEEVLTRVLNDDFLSVVSMVQNVQVKLF